MTLHDIVLKFESGELTPLDLYRQYMPVIEKENERLFAFREINPDWEAQSIDSTKRWQEGQQLSPIDGIPLGIKDNMSTKKLKTCSGSLILENYTAPYDATVIIKLQEAGAIIAGKTNMDEFAMGSSTENSAFGTTKNPVDQTKVPGGSSGGSAAAVAAGFVPVALGSDTGGSIRQPASFCGTVGFKPSYGAVSRYGLLAMASSLDQIGTFSQTVEDSKTIFDIIRGHDAHDSTSNTKDIVKTKESFVIGYDPKVMIEGLDEATATGMADTIAKLKLQDNITLKEVNFEYLDAALATYYIIMPAEVSSNLARFDGIRFGTSDQSGNSLLDVYRNSRTNGFGDEVKRRIMLGTYVLSSGYYDAYYRKAQAVRRAITTSYISHFETVDCLLLPTSPTVAFGFGEKTIDPLQMYLSDIYTVIANLALLPAISLPVKQEGHLPVGIQLIGQLGGDDALLAYATQIEKEIVHG